LLAAMAHNSVSDEQRKNAWRKAAFIVAAAAAAENTI